MMQIVQHGLFPFVFCSVVLSWQPISALARSERQPIYIHVLDELIRTEHGVFLTNPDTLFKDHPRSVTMRAINKYASLGQDELSNWREWPDSLFQPQEGYALAFDSMGRLIEATEPNIMSSYSITYGQWGIDQVVEPNTGVKRVYAYGRNGHLITVEEIRNGFITGLTALTYSADRLVQVLCTRAIGPNTASWQFTYDANGNLVREEQDQPPFRLSTSVYRPDKGRDSTVHIAHIAEEVKRDIYVEGRHADGTTTEQRYYNGELNSTTKRRGSQVLQIISAGWDETYAYNKDGHLIGILRKPIPIRLKNGTLIKANSRARNDTFQYTFDEHGNPLRIIAISTETDAGYTYANFEGAWRFEYTYW